MGDLNEHYYEINDEDLILRNASRPPLPLPSTISSDGEFYDDTYGSVGTFHFGDDSYVKSQSESLTSLTTHFDVSLIKENNFGTLNSLQSIWSVEAPDDDIFADPPLLELTAEMTAKQVQNHKGYVRRAQLLWEDDLQPMHIQSVTYDYLKGKVSEAEDAKARLQEAVVFAETVEGQTDDLKVDDLSALKRQILDFVRRGQVQLRQLEDKVNSSNTAANSIDPVKVALGQARIDQDSARVTDEAAALVQDLTDLKLVQPDNDAAFGTLHDKFVNCERRQLSCIDELRGLISDATQLALKDEALTFQSKLSELKTTFSSAAEHVNRHRNLLAIISQKSSSKQHLDLKPPVFTGSNEDKLDYYTFKTEFLEYCSLKQLSKDEQLRTLLKTSLQLKPGAACRNMSEIEDVWTYLRKTYGSPVVLMNKKIKELKKEGMCDGTLFKKRDWTVTVNSKVAALLQLCEDHDLVDELYHSEVLEILQSALDSNTHKEFQTHLKKQDLNLTKKAIFSQLVPFLIQYQEDLQFQIDYELTSGKLKESAKVDAPRPAKPINQPRSRFTANSAIPQADGTKPGRTNPSKSKRNAPQVDGKVHSAQLRSCVLCKGQHTYAYYCPEFIDTNIQRRYTRAAPLKCCYRCLRMDADFDYLNRETWFKAHKANCNAEFVCDVGACSRRVDEKKVHVVICANHAKDNKDREEDFIKTLDATYLPTPNPVFLFNFSQSNYHAGPSIEAQSGITSQDGYQILPDIPGPAIFLLHQVALDHGKRVMAFYDSGCMLAGISDYAYALLDTVTVQPGPTQLDVAGGKSITLPHGYEQFCLPLADDKTKATLTALRMPQITTRFPVWPLQEAFAELAREYQVTGVKKPLPKVPKQAGGEETGLMIGARYMAYFPELIFSLPSGLGIYRTRIKTADGLSGCLGGPWEGWRRSMDVVSVMSPRSYFSAEARAYCVQAAALRSNFFMMDLADKIQVAIENLDPVVSFDQQMVQYLDQPADEDELCLQEHCDKHRGPSWMIRSDWNLTGTRHFIRDDLDTFLGAEQVGSLAEYRCVSCRNCAQCRKGENLEKVSLAEELEQHLIENSVVFHPEKKQVIATLPFIKDPATHLNENRHIAEAILRSQLKHTSKSEEMRLDVLGAFDKLYSNQHVVELSSLPADVKNQANDGGYFIPWRCVFKQSSLTTPCRLVYDASSKTGSGESLNGILAKGQNLLIRIFDVLLRFRSKQFSFSADVRMAYNGIKLSTEHYKYQKFLWKKDLNPENETEVMCVATLIYGVKSAGNQTSAGFARLADYTIANFPQHTLGAQALKCDAYVDDLMNAQDSEENCLQAARDIEFILAQGGMAVKGFTFSGNDPPVDVSADSKTVGLVGYIWSPREDTISLDIKQLYLEKPKRGKQPPLVDGDVTQALKQRFTRRVLVAKVAGIFDPLGLTCPITSQLKLDLHELLQYSDGWDDLLPDKLLPVWVNNLEVIQSLKGLTFRRSVIPKLAVSNNLTLIVSVDASQSISLCSVHARVEMPNGKFETTLVAAKSKLVHTNTIPRAELKACVLGAVLSQVVRKNFGERVERTIYVTDSTVALYWINMDHRPLQVGVRNAVVEIRRFSSPDEWKHVESAENLADLGTRRAKVQEIGPNTQWQRGKDWMNLPIEQMPLKSPQEVTLSSEEKRLANKEVKAADIQGIVLTSLVSQVSDRYSFSKYVVDPCLLTWPKSVRVLALVFKFISAMKNKVRSNKLISTQPNWSDPQKPILILSHEEVNKAEIYFFKKGTREVKQFARKKDYIECSKEKQGVLYFTGRILDDTSIEAMENVMFDLKPTSFCRPILDRYSPVSYAIMMFCHTSVAHHRNAVATLRISREIAYIIQGRNLAIEIRDNCVFCKRFRGKLLEVELAPLHHTRLTIAPAFWNCQIDLFGPYLATCEHNHRSSVKVWGCIFKCPATCAVAVHAMQAYSAAAFYAAFSRFACRYGYPQRIYIDAGSQLVKACNDGELNYLDLVAPLESKHQVKIEYQVCPVGSHNYSGQAERTIKEIKKLYQVCFQGLKLDLLMYETAFGYIANELNNWPMFLGQQYENLDHLDLLTPARLLLGRNNRRSPTGAACPASKDRLMKQNQLVFEAWWRVWEQEKIIDLVARPSIWKKNSPPPSVGDIVIFLREDNEKYMGTPPWRVGRVKELILSSDDNCRAVIIEYKNSGEKVFRKTKRGVRRIAVLHRESELELVDMLNEASLAANLSFLMLDELNVKHKQFTELPVPWCCEQIYTTSFSLPVECKICYIEGLLDTVHNTEDNSTSTLGKRTIK